MIDGSCRMPAPSNPLGSDPGHAKAPEARLREAHPRWMIVIDFDSIDGCGPAISSTELSLLRKAADALDAIIAIATEHTRKDVARAFAQARRDAHDEAENELAELAFDLMTLSQDEPTAQRTAPALLAELCRAHRATFSSTVAVATRPQDLPIVLEAGIAFALEDAGPACMNAADLRFPARAAGGLAEALRAIPAACAGTAS